MLTKKQTEKIIELLEKGEEIPAEYQDDLFPTSKKEYELVYAGKERKEKIISDTMSVPFQAVKHFGNSKEGDWVNKLIFGDNLQALKHLLKLKKEGKLKNADGTDGVRLVYIDPPFATKKDFGGNKDQKAYSDKVAGAEFIEFVRKRLILLKEIMADNGSIYLHLDMKKVHYIKIIFDEIFGESHFLNEIIWSYDSGGLGKTRWARKHDTLLLYSNNKDYIFNVDDVREPYKERCKVEYKIVNGKKYLRKNPLGRIPHDVWDDISSLTNTSHERLEYPTQKPELLIQKIVRASSNSGDIVLDCFAGSGTTGAVAEKLGRRWIMCDCGKLSIYTIQKRMMNLKKEIGNKGENLEPKPFVLYNAGLYSDGDLLENMQKNEYKEFILELFSCQKRDHKIQGLDFHGTLNNHSVMIFDREHFLTEDFIKDLHKTIGKSVKNEVYIIAPTGMVGFNEDYKVLGDVRYTILRIPNSIIEHVRKKHFERLTQPKTAEDVNQTIDTIGFDFVYPPSVGAEYILKGKKKIIKINEFEPVQLGSKIVEFKDSRSESLAMVMIDLDYDGETFQMDKYWFGEDVIKSEFEIEFEEETGKQIMMIYMDIFGNEKKVVLNKTEFKK